MRRTVGIVAAVICLLATAAPAQAANKRPHQHCVVILPTYVMTCFANFREATAFATNGEVLDAPLDARTAIEDATLTARIDAAGRRATERNRSNVARGAAATQLVKIADVFTDAWFGGVGKTFLGPYACDDDGTAGNDIITPYVGDDMNDRISSFQGYNNCWLRSWEHSNFQGNQLSYRYRDNDLSYGEYFNDMISSIEYT